MDQLDIKSQEEKFFSDEEIEALGPSFGLLPGGTRPYVPKAYREKIKDKSKWPVAIIKAPDAHDINSIEDQVGKVEYGPDLRPKAYSFNSGAQREAAIKICLKDLKGFRNKAGLIVPTFDKDGSLSDETLNKIHPSLQEEFKNAIMRGLELTPEELQGLSY